MKNLPQNIDELDACSKYYLEIDCNGREASGYEDVLPWVCYGTIVAEGNTIDELLDNATVDLLDQDGDDRMNIEADKPWMQLLIQQEYLRLLNKA